MLPVRGLGAVGKTSYLWREPEPEMVGKIWPDGTSLQDMPQGQ
nr:MAG TPA: hypothetical protein [Caudoviricetes sp.]